VARADDFEDEAGGDTGRTARTDAFWDELKIDPVEIALPSGVGYTLRAYRMSSQVTTTDISGREDEFEAIDYSAPYDEEDELDYEEASDADEGADVEVEDDALEEVGDQAEDANSDEGDEEDEELALVDDDSDESDQELDEEVPLFISNTGNLLLFKTAESLVEFVKSGAANDLAQVDEWDKLKSGIKVEHVVATPDDQYELDLVVNNLRGGAEAWDANLIVQSGQLARDLGHSLRIEPVVSALSPGSPLDDLDEALRGVAAGGVGTFFAKRRARKVGKETASLAWRTVIGKISAVVDWRD
jgi:hypothetical protein